jgi:DNA-binding transcriptional LysR family regulator
VALELVESESDEDPLDQVRCGELDLTFALLPLPAGPFGFVELMRDAWMLLVPTDSPLAQRRAAVSLEEAVTLPLIGPRLDRCRMKSDIAERAFESQYLLRTDENGTVHELVAAGVGAGVIAHLAVDLRDERVSALPLEPGVPPRVIALAWHIDRRAQPPANTFIDLARELCAELAVTELSSV